MPVFEYTAISSSGKTSRGSVDAENVRVARQRLRQQGVFPTEIKEGMAARKAATRDVSKYFQSDSISTGDLAIATRQLATLSGAGLPLVSALSALGDQTESQALKRIIVDVKEKVEEGTSLAKAMGGFPKSFPKLYVNMVASGEASGTLDAVLTNLADYLEAQLELKRKVTAALTYPILMLVICSLVVVVLLVWVVPKIVDIFIKQKIALPLPTRIMLGISNGIIDYWFVLIALGALLAWLMRWYYAQPHGRERIDRLILRVPIYGPVFLKVNTARVMRTLGTLLESGVGLLAALDITKNLVNNVHLVRAIEDAREGVQEGRSLARELSKSGLFPPMVGHMIAVGEKSGELEGMLTKVGKIYENEVNAILGGITRLIEPLMMVGVGLVVFSIVMSVLMPMTELINLVEQ